MRFRATTCYHQSVTRRYGVDSSHQLLQYFQLLGRDVTWRHAAKRVQIARLSDLADSGCVANAFKTEAGVLGKPARVHTRHELRFLMPAITTPRDQPDPEASTSSPGHALRPRLRGHVAFRQGRVRVIRGRCLSFAYFPYFGESDPGSVVSFMVRVPAVYLTSAEVSILAFLPFSRINNLRILKVVSGFESRPAHQYLTCVSLVR
jgi:hypothetical protein